MTFWRAYWLLLRGLGFCLLVVVICGGLGVLAGWLLTSGYLVLTILLLVAIVLLALALAAWRMSRWSR